MAGLELFAEDADAIQHPAVAGFLDIVVDDLLAVFVGQVLPGALREQLAPLVAVALGLGMVDVHIIGQGQLPARLLGAQGVIVLLAVPGAKRLFIKTADRIDQLAADHVAEAVQQLHRRVHPGGVARHQLAKLLDADVGRQRVIGPVTAGRKLGDRLPGSGVGQRANDADPGVRLGAGQHTVQPAGGDDGIAVEQDDKVGAGCPQPLVGGKGITARRLVADELDAKLAVVLAGIGRQVLARFRLAAIIHQDQGIGLGGMLLQRGQAVLHIDQGVVHAHDDINAGGMRLQDGGWLDRLDRHRLPLLGRVHAPAVIGDARLPRQPINPGFYGLLQAIALERAPVQQGGVH